MESVRAKMFEASMAALNELLSQDSIHFTHDVGMQRAMGNDAVYYVAELPSSEKIRLEAATDQYMRNKLTITDWQDNYVVDMRFLEGRLQAEIGGMQLVNSPYTSNTDLIEKVARMCADAVAAKRKPFDFEGSQPTSSLSPR